MIKKNHIVFLIPIYDDWNSFEILTQKIDEEFLNSEWKIELLVIDDGSQKSFEDCCSPISELKSISKISILKLKRNLGHQRAIALGLTFIEANLECDAVLIMDGDGEDLPSEAKRLIEKCILENFSKLIFAKRTKRSEGAVFRISYFIYRNFYQILTGKQFRFGNFSIVPYIFLNRLSVISEGWNHYAASVLKARIPYDEIDTIRGVRLSGSSKMNFISLITHGLSSISVYGEVVGVRLLIATLFVIIILSLLIGVVILVRLITLPPEIVVVPGWATYAITILIMILLQSLTLSLFFSFLVLNGRDNSTFLPQRDYHYFISEKNQIYPLEEV